MKSKNLILLILVLFVGMNTSYANNAKVKKIKYAKNVFYIGEAVKTDDGWKPKGKGVLHEINTYYNDPYKCTIEGIFDGEKVTDACIKFGNISSDQLEWLLSLTQLKEIPSTNEVFRGELSYTIPNPSKTEYRKTHITFTSGDFFLEDLKKSYDYAGPISIATPFEYIWTGKNGVKTLCLGKSSRVDRLFNLEEVDRLGLYEDKPYKALVSGYLDLRHGTFNARKGVKLVWEDGTYTYEEEDDDDNEDRVIHYPHLNTTISFWKADYYTKGYYYECVLKDGTYILRCREDEFNHWDEMAIDFGDTYYKGEIEIPGVKSFKDLALKCKDLTKEDISFKYGILVRGEYPWSRDMSRSDDLGHYYVTGDEVLEEYEDGKPRAQREAEEEARKLAEKKAQEEKDAREKAKKEAEEKARKQELTNKYGTRYANAILNREPLIGMTLEMLQEMNYEFELWGIMRSVSWQRTSKTNYNGVVIEHWEFVGYSVTLKNGKVIEINETL